MKVGRASRFLAFLFLLLAIPAVFSSVSSAQIAVGISVRVAPPALPVYDQPICPGPGHLWTPGYWAWSDDDGYYWVPGTWVVAPVGLLWTPGYWGWNDGVYGWHAGYWGPHIGFYGGVNYGFGYGGVGFVGGEWRHGAFFYNTAVMHVDNVHIKNVYVNRTVIVHNDVHVAFNGGEGGIQARPTEAEERAAHEPHREAMKSQVEHEHAASHDKSMFASANHGRPAVAATGRPGEFKGHGVVAAKSAGAPYHAPAMSAKEARASAKSQPAKSQPAKSAKSASAKPAKPAPAKSAAPQKSAKSAPVKSANSAPAKSKSAATPAKSQTAAKTQPARSNQAALRPASASKPASTHSQSQPKPAPQVKAAAPSRASAPQKPKK